MLELSFELLLLSMEVILVLPLLAVFLFGQLELLLDLQPLLDLVIEISLNLFELVLWEVHHLGFKLLEETSCGEHGVDRLGLCLNKSACCGTVVVRKLLLDVILTLELTSLYNWYPLVCVFLLL